MITIVQGISGTYFTSGIPDAEVSTSAQRVQVRATVAGAEIYNETLFTIASKLRLRDLGALFEPYVKKRLYAAITLTFTELTADGTPDAATAKQMAANAAYCSADIGTTAADFLSKHFLSVLCGTKRTDIGRLEYLHYIGTETPTGTAFYGDGTTRTFTPPTIAGNADYKTINVSPSYAVQSGKALTHYDVTAGQRTQRFAIFHATNEASPALVFENSFGVDEVAYCTGTHEVKPEYERGQGYVGGIFRNYRIDETRTHSAATGILTPPMAVWFDEVFRSPNVRLLNFIGGAPEVGKEITITESKSENSNAADAMPSFTFSYRIGQRRQNVLAVGSAGRIFDTTFCNTFN